MKRKLKTVLIIMSAFAIILAGCGKKSDSAVQTAELTDTDSSGASAGEEADGTANDEIIVLKAGTGPNFPPFNYIDENDELAGYDVEVMQEISNRLEGYEIQIEALSWDAVFLALQSHQINLIGDEVTITDEREKEFLFSEPYIEIQSVIAVKAGREDIASLDDLVGKSAAVFVGDSYSVILEEYNNTHEGQIDIAYIDASVAINDLLQSVVSGQYDAFINDPVVITELIQEKGIQAEIVGEPVKGELVGIVFDNTEEGKQLKELIDPVIQEMKADGTLSELCRKWTAGDYVPE